uniref:Cadherin-1-like n=1 Tax=Poecilia reticulata TaxID=8081 RepID=A0A3P9PXN3_POERE
TPCLLLVSYRLFFFMFKFWTSAAADGSSCEPGFESELFILKVSRKNLKPGTRLGKGISIPSIDGSLNTRVPTGVSRGAYCLGESLTQRWLVFPSLHLLHHSTTHVSASARLIPILDFPKSNPGLKRRKRDWIIPPINIPENSRGPFPRFLAEIRSNEDKVKKIHYSISGPGADQNPVNLFTMNRTTGHLHVTQELDREKVDKYMLQVHSVAEGGDGKAEKPMDVIINIIDQNDNKPVFSLPAYNGEVSEASQKGKVIQVVATDADEPNTDNSAIQYRIVSQEPEEPGPTMFTINPKTGVIRVNEVGLDREYTLKVQAADMKGEGLTGFTKVIIKVTDLNDHAPVFTEPFYTVTVEENKVDALVVKMLVTDGDEPHTPAWNAKFSIIDGDPENLFTVKTGTNKQEGIITTAKGLDFERTSKHILLVSVVNEAPFDSSISLVTSTATVVVTVEDVNEPLMFDPKEKHVSKSEALDLNNTVVQYTASDPDTGRKQRIMYKILNDPAGWLDIDKDTGVIAVRNQMDRESIFVREDKYTALIGAYDDSRCETTGTLVIHLQDVNDNPPTIEERKFTVCSKIPVPQLLTVTDRDGPGFTFPYNVSLIGSMKANWTARMTRTGIILTLNHELEIGDYTVTMSIADNQGLSQVSTVTARVCDCSGEDASCREKDVGGSNPPVILGILKAIVVLLISGSDPQDPEYEYLAEGVPLSETA